MAFGREEHIDVVAVFFDAEALWAGDGGLDFVGGSAGLVAILEGGEADSVQGGIGIGGIGVEALADDEAGFSMGIFAIDGEHYVGFEGEIGGDFFPDEVERVGGEPHVFAVAGDGVGFLEGVVFIFAGVEDCADVGVVVENSLGGRGEERGAGLGFCRAHDDPVAGGDAVDLCFGVGGDAGGAGAFGEGLSGGCCVPAVEDDEGFVAAQSGSGGFDRD